MCFHPAKFGLPIGLSVLELCRGTGQTDGQTDSAHFIMPPSLVGGWWDNCFIGLIAFLSSCVAFDRPVYTGRIVIRRVH